MKRIFHVISNTHWDREWRFPFQRNRQMLVDMIDRLIEILENCPDYRAYHLDSQSIVLEDYLEIKPQNEQRLRKLIQAGRLFVGPWYILPDEFQVGGENLIRNLLLGNKISNKYGRVSKIGYSPFSWGQISQLPQIYEQFNIEMIMFYRGVNALDSEKAEFLWEGADGTQKITSRFSTMPRYNFYFYIYRPTVHNEDFQQIEYNWKRGGTPFHFSDNRYVDEDYSLINPTDTIYKENIKPCIEKIINEQQNDFTTPHVIWMEGHDSSGPNEKTVEIIKEIKKQMPGIDVRHSTLEEYAKAVYESVDKSKLALVKGERRSAQYNHRSGNMYGYTTSARMYLKQLNFNSERLLQFYAEPLYTIAGLLGKDTNDQYLQTAWRMLIQNSAHDSIGGCSLDAIHFDMESRYKAIEEICDGVIQRASMHIISNINTGLFPSKTSDEDIFITAINPTFYKRSEVIEAYIDIPENIDKGSFIITDENGSKVEFELIKREFEQPVLEQMTNRPMHFNMFRYRVTLYLEDVPAFGYKTFKINPVADNLEYEFKDSNMFVMENEYLRVAVNDNGTIDMLHKSTKREYKNLAYFEDEGEAGHAWVHKVVGKTINSKNAKTEIYWLENNSLMQVIQIIHEMEVPEDLASRRNNENMRPLDISTILVLAKGNKRLEFSVSVHNMSESHRLRIMFPFGIKANYSYGEGQFDVVKRSTQRPDTSEWVEQPMYDYPMHQFAGVEDNTKGVAIAVDGLKEYEVLDDEENTMAVTLFRGFEYKIAPAAEQNYSFEKGAQMLGESNYYFALYPYSGNSETGEVYPEALNFNTSLRLVQSGSSNGKMPLSSSFYTITPGNLIFSCLKAPENKNMNMKIIRVYNPTNDTIAGKITSVFNINKAFLLTLEEKVTERIEHFRNNTIEFEANAKKIITIGIQ